MAPALVLLSHSKTSPAGSCYDHLPTMSGLIDIWTLERERMVQSGRAQAFGSVVSFGGGERQGRRDTVRSESGGSSSAAAAKPCDGVGAVVVDAAEKQAAASASAGSSPPGFVREDAFLSILIDCFGQ
jgi:hypothetical protein